ncbi:MAG: thioredoxin domain-containing protein [Deltaproteobacteria bacterium]|nr:thioredoxin domain-containing protein [Deltaproteobacteria bacterium]
MSVRANRLAAESSPYLRQHQHNPVDWYPWGDEALERARREDKPILLSIGYSACHWCHVMERESFENPATAALMNASFVSVKVDREERPDLDTIYMNAVQMLTGSGGWPLTVFLTPDGEPFYGGTYFPPDDRYGRPGFPRVLESLARAWRDSREEVARSTQQLMAGLDRLSRFEPKPDAVHPDTVARGAERLLQHCDPDHGGIGGAPKFPNVPAFALLLRRWHATGRGELLDVVTRALTAMARGGIHDQLGGGFHRYSVDAQWLVPHFEKMLYDNAQLVPLYLDAFLATGDPLYRDVARRTLDYLQREMTHPEGGLYSSQDADTEGEEGKTYLWRIEEIRQLLDPETAEIVCRYYQVDEVGNFAEPGHSDRKSILHVALTRDELGRLFRRDPSDTDAVLERGRHALLAARNQRPQPGLDDKILTSWNALAIRAFARGAAVLDDRHLLDAAVRVADFLDAHLTRADGRLLRTWKDGVARHPAYLDDHAFLATACLDLFAATGNVRHLATARRLAEILLRDFADDEAGGFFFTARGHERLVDRPKVLFDGSLPSGNAVAIEVLLRLADLDDDPGMRAVAERALRLFGAQMEKQPFGTAYLLGVLDDFVRGPVDVVIAGPRSAPETRALERAAHAVYLPNAIVFIADPADAAEAASPIVLRDKAPIDGHAAAYVCRDFACSAPVTDPAELQRLLRG